MLDRKDVLAVLPTGAGKSLCYQLPALHLEGVTIIVSPLISLMKDQVDKLQELELAAVQVNSTQTASEELEALRRIRAEDTDFVFTTPERLTDPRFLADLAGVRVGFVVIDEARVVLAMLKYEGVVRERRGAQFLLIKKKVTASAIARMVAVWRARADRDGDRLEQMEAYARSAKCRWEVLHQYFGDVFQEARCHRCDNCRKGLAELASTSASLDITAGGDSSGSSNGVVQETETLPSAEVEARSRVSLPRHGTGTVEEIEGDVVAVRCRDGVLRRFKREFVRPAG